MPPPPAFKDSPERKELLALYAEVDALLAPFTCDASGDCCHFARTGREPYPTAIELAEVQRAVRAAPPGASSRSLPLVERRCPLLSGEGRCTIYGARPFGCRTFFCEEALGKTKLPRRELLRLGRAVADLSARFDPRDPHPRPLTRALGGR